jgi:hypothetical protein
MAQQGNTYTGKLADMPTYLTRNHMYLAYDTLELYGFDEQGNPFKLAPLTPQQVQAIINTQLEAGNGITLTFDEETEKLRIDGQNLTTDFDLHIDENEVIRNNISEFPEVFVWRDGDPQTFITEFDMVSIRSIEVNGQSLIREQFDCPLKPRNEFTILDPLDDGDYIQITYTHYIFNPN